MKEGIYTTTLELYRVEENGKLEMEQKWEHSYGKLAPGEYKLVKTCFKSDRDSYKEPKDTVSVDFVIKDNS